MTNPSTALVVVFHDRSYQHIGVGRPAPEWPENCLHSSELLPIVRNPGPVRDQAMPFSSELQTKNLADTHGQTKYFRTVDDVDDNAAGDVRRRASSGLRSRPSEVRMVDVEVCSKRTPTYQQLQTSKYAVKLAAELERIRHERCHDKEWWAQCTAVVVPGCPAELAGELLKSTIVEARANNLKEVENALSVVASEFRPHALYFGAVENIAGLDRPFVLLTGMQHPAYIAHREEHEKWNPNERNRVDPRAYIGITRCTVELTVVEIKCGQYALHFGISGAGAGGIVSLIGDPFHEGEARRAYASGGIVTAGVTVDLKSPPDANVLATAVSLRMTTVTSDLWESSRFRWAQCTKGVHELNMSGSFRVEDNCLDRDGGVLAYIDLWSLHEHLEVLYLNGNCFADLSPRLGELTSLKQLYLEKNELVSIPGELGRLTKLDRLRLDHNKLASVPSELSELTALDRLYLDNNKLSSLPAELGSLTKLTRLTLYSNELSSVPAELGQLTSLTSLNLSRNKLESVPPELGHLTNLKALFLSDNQLVSVPPELGQLTSLTQLRMDKNIMHGPNSLPAEIGQLSLLTELRLDDNRLTALPAELGLLTKLMSLYLYKNMLVSVPRELGQLSSLTMLLLDHNQLLSVPSELGQLAKLKTLNLSYNQLSFVPAEFGQLLNLTQLSLSQNKLVFVPPELRKLTKLKKLCVQANNITRIPSWVASLAPQPPLEGPTRTTAAAAAPGATAVGSAAVAVMMACLAVLIAWGIGAF